MSDDKIRRFLEKNSIASLNASQLDRYMTIATPEELEKAKSDMFAQNNAQLVIVVSTEQQKRVESERHGEGMLASAFANRRANQALSVGVGALILALIAILQQCRG